MRICLLLIAVPFVVSGLPARKARQVWNFPEDTRTSSLRPFEMPSTSTQTQFRPQPQPSTAQTNRQGTTTSRPQTTRQRTTASTTTSSGSSTTPTPGIVFQIPDCDCVAPPQYNPVCGTNGVSYVNSQKLECARQCGVNVQVQRLGTCTTPRR